MKTLILLILPLFGNAQCPVITQQPVSQSDCETNSIRMIVTSDATQFQWEKKRPQDAAFAPITGATQASYQIYPSGGTLHPSGTQYRVKLNEATCLVTSEPATITLHTIATITNPQICERGDGRLEAQIPTVNQATDFQWTLSVNNAPFEDLVDNSSYAGTQTPNLSLKQVTASMDGYRYKIRMNFAISPNNDNEGSLTNQNQVATCPRSSNDVILQVKTSPIPVHPASLYKGCKDRAITLNSNGCSPYTTQWYDRDGNPMAQGAKAMVTLADLNPHIYTATCLKLGCESLPSRGTSAQAFNQPNAPANAGTPESICPNLPITFKASGGTNNIWYVSAQATTAVSTATQITVSGQAPESTTTRFVSQSINNCESPRTAIQVRVKSNRECGEITLPPSPPPAPEDSSSLAPPVPEEPTLIVAPLPVMTYSLSPNCGRGSYQLTVMGCPNTPQIFNQYGPEKLIGQGESIAIPATAEAYIQIRCPGAAVPVIQVTLPEMRKPEIQIETNYANFACSDDEIKLHAVLPPYIEIIGWELNGHLISDKLSISGQLPGGFYQPVVRKNGCIHRGDGMYIEVHERPAPPQITLSAQQICLGDTIQIETNASLVKWITNTPINKKFVGPQGSYSFSAQASTDGVCWSAASTPKTLLILPVPLAPTILTYRDAGFCPGDSTQLRVNTSASKYAWNTGDSTQMRYSKVPESTRVKISDPNGCWSAWSTTIRTFHFPAEPQPSIYALPNKQFCQGGQVTVFATPAFRYVWNVGGEGDSLVVKNSATISVKTQNEFGCWSAASSPITLLAQPNPTKPLLDQVGTYFIRARSVGDQPDHYSWKMNEDRLPDSTAQVKMKDPGIYAARAEKTYKLSGEMDIRCVSDFRSQGFSFPVELDGLSMYPNPTNTDELTLEILADAVTSQIELVDFQGHIVHQWELGNSKNRNRLRLPKHIANGNYLIRMEAAGELKNKLISIMR